MSEPIIVEADEDGTEVLTICSDGIWDVLTPDQVYDIMHEPSMEGCLHAASQSVVVNARHRRSGDDISVVAVRLRQSVI